ncbi:MAG: hypothetical protein HYV04_00215 [Deltaproteobacteria bacterium]|nr:hypothetical protein [Deltaproteobacteria bacterium]
MTFRNFVHAFLGAFGFGLDGWVETQKEAYGRRDGVAEELDRKAAQFNGELLGLSGTLLDEFVHRRPRLVPQNFWGGDLGWRSAKRKKRWEDLLTRSGISVSATSPGMVIRFDINASEWVPHPYAPPHWATHDFSLFSQYISHREDAFELCRQWRAENSIALTQRLQERLRRFPVQLGASYRRQDHHAVLHDYADVAFLLPCYGTDLLQVKTVWQGETALVDLVRQIFRDAVREYSPDWLMGQRIDVFIPSLQVGFEYHGEQHYRPVEHFGGKEGFLRSKKRDQRKLQACRNAGVSLIEWKFTEPINESNLRRKLEAIGVEKPVSWRRGSAFNSP